MFFMDPSTILVMHTPHTHTIRYIMSFMHDPYHLLQWFTDKIWVSLKSIAVTHIVMTKFIYAKATTIN